MYHDLEEILLAIEKLRPKEKTIIPEVSYIDEELIYEIVLNAMAEFAKKHFYEQQTIEFPPLENYLLNLFKEKKNNKNKFYSTFKKLCIDYRKEINYICLT